MQSINLTLQDLMKLADKRKIEVDGITVNLSLTVYPTLKIAKDHPKGSSVLFEYDDAPELVSVE
ncbi:hypothetical protein HDF14_005029 [Edaphobacter lichenicola]|uniref:Uncharacterized protein n=2 Tax=Tunturiibacter gelidiferens TaxID=3069689 RepID=A0A9X0QJB0_9BACT|nr:hypothetical protein [Edaphobacter lichenicola]